MTSIKCCLAHAMDNIQFKCNVTRLAKASPFNESLWVNQFPCPAAKSSSIMNQTGNNHDAKRQ